MELNQIGSKHVVQFEGFQSPSCEANLCKVNPFFPGRDKCYFLQKQSSRDPSTARVIQDTEMPQFITGLV